jgi:hypothetical protein
VVVQELQCSCHRRRSWVSMDVMSVVRTIDGWIAMGCQCKEQTIFYSQGLTVLPPAYMP